MIKLNLVNNYIANKLILWAQKVMQGEIIEISLFKSVEYVILNIDSRVLEIN